jgi:hypothetical protein
VSLYSTKWVDVKANGQDTQGNGSCTIYITKRQRTFLDGRVENDFTKAQYRAGEGQNCGDDQAPEDTTTSRPGTPASSPTTRPPAAPSTTRRATATTATTKAKP